MAFIFTCGTHSTFFRQTTRLHVPPQRLREHHSPVPELRQLQRARLQTLGMVHVSSQKLLAQHTRFPTTDAYTILTRKTIQLLLHPHHPLQPQARQGRRLPHLQILPRPQAPA
jgi:hypothetical protein